MFALTTLKCERRLITKSWHQEKKNLFISATLQGLRSTKNLPLITALQSQQSNWTQKDVAAAEEAGKKWRREKSALAEATARHFVPMTSRWGCSRVVREVAICFLSDPAWMLLHLRADVCQVYYMKIYFKLPHDKIYYINNAFDFNFS